MDTLTTPPRTRRPVVTLWLLRIALTTHLLAVLCQPVLAGLFLTGDVDAIEVHATVASLVGLLMLATAGIAVAYGTAGRGRRWPIPAALGLFVLEAVQIAIGYARALQWHVPVGVAVVVVSVLFAAWAWTPSAGRPRPTRALPSLQDLHELQDQRRPGYGGAR